MSFTEGAVECARKKQNRRLQSSLEGQGMASLHKECLSWDPENEWELGEQAIGSSACLGPPGFRQDRVFNELWGAHSSA